VIANPGADLAPWNLRSHQTRWGDARDVVVDDQPLIFFHFHGLDRDARRFYFKHAVYRAKTTEVVRDGIYRPFLADLTRVEGELPSDVGASAPLARRGLAAAVIGTVRRRTMRAVAQLRGDSIEVAS
jgi:hypothetical protein